MVRSPPSEVGALAVSGLLDDPSQIEWGPLFRGASTPLLLFVLSPLPVRWWWMMARMVGDAFREWGASSLGRVGEEGSVCAGCSGFFGCRCAGALKAGWVSLWVPFQFGGGNLLVLARIL